MRRRWTVQLLLIATAAAVSCDRLPASDTVVERLHVSVVVQTDGSLDVTETVAARSFTQPPRPFERHLRRSRVDRFADVRASVVDADPDPSISARIEVDRRGDVRVVWPVGAGEAGRTFRLQYRAPGALEVEGSRAWLRHPILPLDPPSPIAAASVEVELPSAATVIAPPSMAGRDWAVVETSAGATLTRSGLTTGEDAVLTAELDVRALSILVPDWQQNADRAREMAPAFLSGAFFLLVIGLGAVIMVRVQYPKRQALVGQTHVREVARGLAMTGLLVLAIGAATAAGTTFAIERYGRAVATIPASFVIVGLVMVAEGVRLGRGKYATS